VDGEERNRVDFGIDVRDAQPRKPDYREGKENKNRNCEIEVRRGWTDGSTQQQHCNADPSYERAPGPEFPHVSIVADACYIESSSTPEGHSS
jgi:hypothetical protein